MTVTIHRYLHVVELLLENKLLKSQMTDESFDL